LALAIGEKSNLRAVPCVEGSGFACGNLLMQAAHWMPTNAKFNTEAQPSVNYDV